MSTLLLQQPAPALPWLADAHDRERAFLQRAQAGEQVRDEIILYLQPRIIALAVRMHERLAQGMRNGNVIERGDLVNSANIAMLASYQAALTKENPFGYLFKAAKVAMIHYLNGRTGHLMNTRDWSERITVLSLDLAKGDGQTLADELACELHLPNGSESQHLLHIWQAIDALPEKQRSVIQRYFGFSEHAPESLNQISLLFSTSPRTGSARRHYRQALNTLRQVLTLPLEHEIEHTHQPYSGGVK